MSHVEEFFEAIGSGKSEKVRSLLINDRTVSSAKNKGDYKFDASVELDAYKFLGAYIGALTGLQYALIIGLDAIAKDIIDYTFQQDLDIQFGKGNTALHLAVFLGSKEVVKLLLERGADRTVKNGKGFTPVDVSDDADVLKILSNVKAPGLVTARSDDQLGSGA